MIKNSISKFGFLCAVMLTFLFVLPLHKTAAYGDEMPWVKVKDTSLIRDNKPFRFIGANAVNLVFYDDWDLDVERAISTAKENNISVLRLYMDWGWGKDEDIDNIVDLASKYGIYVILTLTDCCCSRDYASLENYFEIHAPFCNIKNKQSIAAFKRRIGKIINRKNSINGKRYRDDPTILAWEIANELEYWHFNLPEVSGWINDIAAYVKTLDKKHLLTIGVNMRGKDSLNNNSLYATFNVPELDFVSFHSYPVCESSGCGDGITIKEQEYLIEFIAKKFILLGKPVIMGEFGFANSTGSHIEYRSPREGLILYNSVFKKYMDAAFYAGCSGVMFWGWGIPEEKNVPMWWGKESHSIDNKNFCVFLKKYRIPEE